MNYFTHITILLMSKPLTSKLYTHLAHTKIIVIDLNSIDYEYRSSHFVKLFVQLNI